MLSAGLFRLWETLHTISSSHIGQVSFEPEAAGLEAPRLMLEVRSWAERPAVTGGLETGGEMDDEVIDRVLSEGAKGLVALCWAADGAGDARPFPLPRMRPPPSFRPDMAKRWEWQRRRYYEIIEGGPGS